MKTKLLTALTILLFVAPGIHAQITQGKYLLGGGIRFGHSQDDQNGVPPQNYLVSNIQIGKAFKENTVAGVILSYSYADVPNINKVNYYSGGLFYRKYKPLAKGLYFFGEADAVYAYSKSLQGKFGPGDNGSRAISNEVRISFAPGLSYAILKNMQIELSMPDLLSVANSWAATESYFVISTDIVTSKSNNFNASANLNANLLNNLAIGFKFLFGK